MNTHGGYLQYFVLYLVLTAVVTWLTRRYYRIRWIDSAIAANGLLSSIVLTSLLIAAAFGASLPYKLSPAALVSVVVVFFNNFKGNISRFAQGVPTPTPSMEEKGEQQDVPLEDHD